MTTHGALARVEDGRGRNRRRSRIVLGLRVPDTLVGYGVRLTAATDMNVFFSGLVAVLQGSWRLDLYFGDRMEHCPNIM